MAGATTGGESEPATRSVVRAFLVSDIRGYSSFTAAHGSEAASALAGRFARISTEVLDPRGAEIISRAGDDVVAAFESPRAALEAAVELQSRLLDATREDPSLPLPAGIGLDFGEAVVSADGWNAHAINVAARLCSIAAGGEILASAELAHVASTIGGLTYADRTQVVVKGIEKPVRLVRVHADETDFAQGFRDLGLPRAAPSPASRRWTPIATLVVTLGVAGAGLLVLLLVLTGGGAAASLKIGTDSVGALNIVTGQLERSVQVGDQPGPVASALDAVWVVDNRDDTVTRVDAQNVSAAADTINVGHDPTAVATGGGATWVANSGDGTVSRINPGPTPTVGDTIRVGNGPSGIAVGDGYVWVANSIDDTVTVIDPRSDGPRPADRIVGTIPVEADPDGVVVGFGSVWVACAGASTVDRIDPSSMSVAASIDVGNGPSALVSAPSGIWVTNTRDDTVSQIVPDSDAVEATIPVGQDPTGVAVSANDIWVTNSNSDYLTEIDAPADDVLRTVDLDSSAQGAVLADGRLWVSVRAPSGRHRGGTLRIVVSNGEADSFDPAIGYSAIDWGVEASMNDGLVTFQRTDGPAGGAIVPDLATSIPVPTDGGRVYTFTLRQGIRYSTGALVRARDVRASLQRAFEVGGAQSPVTYYYSGIVGATRCSDSHRSCDLSQGVITDDALGTVTVRLEHPDPEFLYKLALPFADVLPAGTPSHSLGFGPHPATGPYEIARGTAHQIILVRNPDFVQWSADAQPDGYPDQIDISATQRADTAGDVAAVAAGKADWTPDPATGQQVSGLIRTRSGQLHPYDESIVRYYFLNTSEPPFNDVAVRRALNLAVDRRAAAADLGGRLLAEPTCQPLAPSLFGYHAYCPYTVDPDRSGQWKAPELTAARALVRKAHAAGMLVRVAASPDHPQVASVIASALRSIGLRATIRSFKNDTDYYNFIGRPANHVQAGLEGWIVDYPEPSNLFAVLLRCNDITPSGNLDESMFCDPAIDREMSTALQQQGTNPAAAGPLWDQIDRQITDKAPWVPLVNDRGYDIVSSRGGDYEHNPEFGMLFDQAWLR